MADARAKANGRPPLDLTDPYVDWWRSAEGRRRPKKSKYQKDGDAPQSPFDILDLPRGFFRLGQNPDDNFEIPLPAGAKNPCFLDDFWNDWKATPSDYPHIKANDVILGVIDTNFALGHHRLRFQNGKSRVLAAWFQGADHNKSDRHMPFGREYSNKQIEELIKKHSSNSLRKPLDQDAFHRCIGAVDADKPTWEGSKELQTLMSHGTHMLDVAGGIEPGQPGAKLSGRKPRCHVIAVSLPPLFFHGHSGNFLQYHAVLGLLRIIRIADEISAAKGFGKDHQFPIVVNFSFGFEAGPKDGSLDMERSIRNQIRQRARETPHKPLRWPKKESAAERAAGEASNRPKALPIKTFVNMPAGNSNLDRIAANLTVWPAGHDPFEVVVQPNDHSSTFIEFWSETLPRNSDFFDDFYLNVQPPDGLAVRVHLEKPKKDETKMVDLKRGGGGKVYGRVYYEMRSSALRGPERMRLRVVVALAPTLVFYSLDAPVTDTTPPPKDTTLASAGRWKFDFQGITDGLRFDAYIQADLFDGPFMQNARRAYFDDRRYRTHDEGGHVIDSFACNDPHTPLDEGPIRRIGTHNALATTPYVTMIGGFHTSSGCSAAYSATGFQGPSAVHNRSDVDAALPCEDGDVHFGVLGAGPRDGAALALNGTSVATALASRKMVDALLQNPGTRVGQPWLQTHARAYEISTEKPDHYQDPVPLKMGVGRLPYPQSYGVTEPGQGMRVRRRRF